MPCLGVSGQDHVVPLPFQMATQMETGGGKQEGRGFGAGLGAEVQGGLWGGGSAQPQSELPLGEVRVGSETLRQHFPEPGAEVCLFRFSIYFVGISWGKVGNIFLTGITYVEKRK